MRQVESPLQLSPRRSPLAGPAQGRTVVGERPGQLDRRGGRPENRDRLAEQLEASIAPLDQAEQNSALAVGPSSARTSAAPLVTLSADNPMR